MVDIMSTVNRALSIKKVGFIGLGDQGAPIARRMIQAGLHVSLWARRPDTLQPFAGTEAELHDDFDTFAGCVDCVGICVVDDEGVKQVCDRLIPKLHPGSIIVIHSTVSPTLCRKLAQDAADFDIKLIDAPVSGGSPAAEAGTMTVMVGGDPSVLSEVRFVFETFARLVTHLGGVGSGQHAKLINNALLAANMGVAYKALVAADALSLDKAAFIELVKASSGQSFGFDVCAKLPTPNAFHHGASLLVKDVALLGAALNGHESFETIDDAASAFLNDAFAPSGQD